MNEAFRCKACDVSVPYNAHCPLCGRLIREMEPSLHYPVAVDKRAVTKKILKFLFIISGVICVFFDVFFSHSTGWSLIACGALLIVWVSVFMPIFGAGAFGIHVLYDVLVVWAVLFVIDLWFGFGRWSITYVWPAAVAAGITLILLGSLIGRLRWSVVASPLFILALMSIVMTLLNIFGIYKNAQLWLIIALYAGLCIFGLKYFLNRLFQNEIGRLFHL